ncbi:MAG TPA: ZIP family metal transporter [Terriglobales bacterium]|nr:ZIP family metal transporter [Terriglobales bacterium]
MSLVLLKVVCGLAVFAGALAGGLLPLRRGLRDAPGNLLGRGNAFAAGMFLGIGLVHMLPEADEMWRPFVADYPVAALLAAIAFLLVLFFEHVALPPHRHGPAEGIDHGSTELTYELAAHAGRQEFYAYTLLIALSVHSVISGIALGAQTEAAGAFVILLALVAHKASEGLGLGVSLVRNGVPSGRAGVLLACFAATTPIGIWLGSVASERLSSEGAQQFNATFVALAAGTFIYIASLDIIGEEFTHGGDRGAKWCLALAGLAIAAVLALWL